MEFTGEILSGNFDQLNDTFILQQVKQHTTTSSFNKNQFQMIYEYLNQHTQDSDGQVLSLNDQLLIQLSQEELSLFMNDLDRIRPMFQ
ncbi:hypothetical protein SAMN05421743_101344 [Thalassobacillus cyri]|uniref:Uncharacterized protein n=1 Tax=Thalassobacillus cyri TaxID=571932 RepID=A0A1H3W745_9BACI|nr:hypothetical protein [Thalassobacillus cyri]SDZ82925.1 hypothetical protein SAMN05421743_101344 [Thalassobacillus cyri]